jgi:hypothetical protein
LYNIYNIDTKSKYKELERMRKVNESNHLPPTNINYRTYQVDINGEKKTIDIDNDRYLNNKEHFENNNTDYVLESGIYDSNGDINNGTYYGPLSNKTNVHNINYSLDEMKLYEKHNKIKPTQDNPFMNPSINDFNTENITVPANSDDKDIQIDADIKFNDDIYKDFQDVFNKKNSQRQFFTVAHNVPNDQEAFARWCYKFPPTCKTTQERCLRYQDLRTKHA